MPAIPAMIDSAARIIARPVRRSRSPMKPLSLKVFASSSLALLVALIALPAGAAQIPPAAQPHGEVASSLRLEGSVTGRGATPVGRDRGQLGNSRIHTLARVRGRVLLEEKNLRFRALTDDREERSAVEQAFANSVLWG